MTIALVLGGGGVAGIAWEVGVLLGLTEAGLDLSSPDLVVGTSAGSVVGAQLRLGRAIPDLYDAQLAPPVGEVVRDYDRDEMMTRYLEALEGADDPRTARARIGRLALDADTPSEAMRREIISTRLGGADWPSGRLLVTAVDAESGEPTVFDADSGVHLVDAVAASCAVPGVWPPVTIGGRRYVDGGVRSLTAIDLAAGSSAVLCLAPMRSGPVNPLGPTLEEELEAVGTDRVHVVEPDVDSLAAFGSNPLDPATREPSARAGRRVGAAAAEAVRAIWAER